MFGLSIGNWAIHNRSKNGGVSHNTSGRGLGSEGLPSESEASKDPLESDIIEDGFERSDRHAAELKAIKREQVMWGASFGAVPLVGPAMSGSFLGQAFRSDGVKLTKLKRIGASVALGAAGFGLGLLSAVAGPGGIFAGLVVSSLVGAYAATKDAEAEYKHFGEKRDKLVESADFVESMEFPSINMQFDTNIHLKTGNTLSMNDYAAYLNGEIVTRCTREWDEDGIHLGSGSDQHTIRADGSSHVSWTSKEQSYQVDRDANGDWGPVMTKGSEGDSEWKVSDLKLKHDKERLVVGAGESLADAMEVNLMVDPKDIVGH